MPSKIVRNVAGSWLGLATNMVVGFFLTRFILHRLGDLAFGLWVLMTAVTGYYGLLDLGIRNAIIRYVARYHATGESEELSKVVSTGFFTYVAVAALAAVISIVAAAHARTWFKLSGDAVQVARQLLLVVGIGTAVGMPISLFAGVLEGLQRFALNGTVQALAILVRAGLVVAGLMSGYGIVFVGVVTAVVNLLTNVVLMCVAFRLCAPRLLRWSHASRGTFAAVSGFGLVTFWIGIAGVMRFQLDSLVVATCISVPAVTFFAAGGRLVTYGTEVVQSMAQVFTPMSSALDASGNLGGLRRVLLIGNRYSAFIAFPIAAILLLIGPRVIQAWLGAAYVSSQSVLNILAVPTALYFAQATSPKVLYGMARHKTLAAALLVEGGANLFLSVVLARYYGIDGVAIGTAVPLFCTSVFFLPIHLCRLLKLRMSQFLLGSFAHPVLLVIPLAVVVHVLDARLISRTWVQLIEILAIASAFYGAELLAYFWLVERPNFAGRGAASLAEEVLRPGD